jgi:hypothetical protein
MKSKYADNNFIKIFHTLSNRRVQGGMQKFNSSDQLESDPFDQAKNFFLS